MDKYHIYEEIGKGNFSQVFKGREKKKIEYVAIKRIEKSVMSKIVNEVQIMHKLHSVHTLKFHDWYETRNNLWLILEYCTGADLSNLLKQDKYLPEASVRLFGLDVLAALKYLHSMGIIHGDVRPRNFLIDEYGILKLGDFKYSRKIPTQKDRGYLEEIAVANRCSSASYLSPELFTKDGVHSMESDFWMMGVMLYELRRGTLPFGDDTIHKDQLIEQVRTVEPIFHPLPLKKVTTNSSSETDESGSGNKRGRPLHEVLSKAPSLSAEFADLLLWLLEKAPMNRCNWSSLCNHPYWSPHNPTPPTQIPSQPLYEIFIRSLQSSRSKALEDQALQEYGFSARDTVSASVTPSLTSTPQRGTPQRLPSSTSSAYTTPQRGTAATPSIGNESLLHSKTVTESRDGYVEETKSNTVPLSQNATPERNQSAAQQAAYALQQQQQYDHRQNDSTIKNKTHEETNPDTSHNIYSTKHSQAADILESFRASNLLIHPSDNQVKPIVGNKAIEVIEKVGFNVSGIPFPALTAEQLNDLNQSDLEIHLTQVYKALQKTAAATSANLVNTTAANALLDREQILTYLMTIASSAEAANVVLNTNFLNLVLRLMKCELMPGGTTTNTSPRQRNQPTPAQLITKMNQTIAHTRVLAATVLAMMLRYATYLQPPNIRDRDNHIVMSIVTMMRGQPKLDVKFRRRAIAALGETVFYITAQEEDNENSNDDNPSTNSDLNNKWVLPAAAVEFILKCLKDEPDEIVKHYVVKTLENVLAQGAMEYKRMFVNVDLAVRLIELSQQSTNETMQGSCGMAFSHVIMLVLTAYHDAISKNISASEDMNNTGKVNKQSLASTNTIIMDLFNSPSPVLGCRFVAKVLERGGLAGIIEALRDGPSKLQQAYLNVVNMIFSAPLPLSSASLNSAKDIGYQLDSAAWQSANVALRMSRNFFIKSQVFVPVLINLTEQGGVSAVRGKALIALQLLSSHSAPILATLVDGRLPSIIVRILSSVISDHENLERSKSRGSQQIEFSYFVRVALSTVHAWNCSCVDSVSQLVHIMSGVDHPEGREFQHGEKTLPSSPSRGMRYDAGQNTLPPTPISESRVRQGATPVSTYSHNDVQNIDNVNNATGNMKQYHSHFSAADVQKIRRLSSIVSSVLSTAAQPALRRLLFNSGLHNALVGSISNILRIMPNTQAAIDVKKRQLAFMTAGAAADVRGSNNSIFDRESEKQLQEEIDVVASALRDVEHSCLIALEMISQMDYSTPLQVFSESHNYAPSSVMPSLAGTTLFRDEVATRFLPAVVDWLSHSSGDIKVVITASLRRLLPPIVRLYLASMQDATSSLVIRSAIGLINHLPILLNDNAPVPQYSVRLLQDILSASTPAVIAEFVKNLKISGAIKSLVAVLHVDGEKKGRRNQLRIEHGARGEFATASVDEEDNLQFQSDPQLAVLLRSLCEVHGGAAALLEVDIASSLAPAVNSAVGNNLIKFLCAAEHSQNAGEESLLDMIRDCGVGAMELVMSEVDLLHMLLHLVIRELSNAEASSASASNSKNDNSQQELALAETHRRQLAPLRAAAPSLLVALAYSSYILRELSSSASGHEDSKFKHVSGDEEIRQASAHLIDSVSRSLGILFDLYPDTLTNQLLSKQSVTNGYQRGSGDNDGDKSVDPPFLPPREVLSLVLINTQVDLKVRIRLLKIITGISKMAASMNISLKAKEFLRSSSIQAALQICSTSRDTTSSGVHDQPDIGSNADHNLFVKLANQILDLGARM